MRGRVLLLAALSAFGAVEGRAEEANVGPRPDAVQGSGDSENLIPALGPLQLSMFVDAYAAYQTGGKGTLSTRSGHRAFTGQGANGRAENGFGLAFLGLDARYETKRFGAVVNFRFGQAARLFHGDSDLPFGVDYLTQAYGYFRPLPALQIDLGMFMSPFGVEALESFKNLNYTISALYTYGQPNWHTGLRATYRLGERWTFMAMVVNGANNISEAQQNEGLEQTPTLGGGIGYEIDDYVSFALGGMAALHTKHNDDEGIDAFLDLVGTLELDRLTVWLNVDYIRTRDGAPGGEDRNFLGGSLTAGYSLHEVVRVAARGEYMRDDASFDGRDVWQLYTGTLTLDLMPLPGVPYLLVRWENRWEHSNQRVFGKSSRGTPDPADDGYGTGWYETVLGMVVTTSVD